MAKVKEIWKDVVGYEEIYEVSNTGKVRTKLGKITYQHYSGFRVWKQRELKIIKDKKGICSLNLWKNGKMKGMRVHRLVAIAFIKNTYNYPMINHIDGNPSNNNVENLEWCNAYQNNMHAINTGLRNIPKIELKRELDGNTFYFIGFINANKFLNRSKYHIQYQLYTRKLDVVDGYKVKVLLNEKN